LASIPIGARWSGAQSPLSDKPHVEGFVAPGMEPVRAAFQRNFADGHETGASFAAWRRGELLLNIWGGEARPGQPWQRDTLQLIFSGSKGLTAICMLMLIERQQIALDRPVSDYWPAFGKPGILVSHVVSHTARLPGFSSPTTWEEMLDDRLMATRLAAQPPFEDPRAALTYHPVTYGWLCGELLRQVDGRSLGRFLAEEIAGPMGLEIWFGLPAEHEHRVSLLYGDPNWGRVTENRILPSAEQVAADPLRAAIWYNPPLFGPEPSHWNTRALHAAEMPGAGAIGTARSVAKLYDALVNGQVVRPEIVKAATRTLSDGFDVINSDRRRFGTGFSLQVEKMQFGPKVDGFGHGGAGGSVHGAWPTEGVGFSYAMNRLIDTDDPRGGRILDALSAALASRSGSR
jgi:CubicO group peptidase (beta-lactamase class C family)